MTRQSGRLDDTADDAQDDAARLRALHRQRILDTEPEEAFDRVVRVTAASLGVPISAISFVDADRQWFKARLGLGVRQTTRDVAFCDHTIRSDAALIVPDAGSDLRFAANPLVTGDPGIRAYLGVPLSTADGFRIGTVCAIDTRARPDFGPDSVRLMRDLGDMVAREMELREIAQTDELTGLASRRYFLAEAQREGARAQRRRRPLSIGYLDIDHFKRINDSFGHNVGDHVLAGLARRLAAAVRAEDLLGRLGGEEFGLLLPETDAQEAVASARRLLHRVAGEPFETPAGPIRITLSVGVATAETPADAVDELIELADRQLYRAKIAGRNRVAFASLPPSMAIAV